MLRRRESDLFWNSKMSDRYPSLSLSFFPSVSVHQILFFFHQDIAFDRTRQGPRRAASEARNREETLRRNSRYRRDDARDAANLLLLYRPPPSLALPSSLPPSPAGRIKGGESWERNNERPPRTPARTHTHMHTRARSRARLRARALLANERE